MCCNMFLVWSHPSFLQLVINASDRSVGLGSTSGFLLSFKTISLSSSWPNTSPKDFTNQYDRSLEINQWNYLSLCLLGGYVYTEASEPQMLGHRAMLMGPRMCGRMCLQFYYNMYGKRMGSLNVYKREGMQNDDMIWTLSGNQGKDWHEAIVDVGGACYQVRTSSLSWKCRPTHKAMGCF